MHSLSTNVLLKKKKKIEIFQYLLCRKIFQQPSSIRRLIIIFGDIRQILISAFQPPHAVVQIVSASYLSQWLAFSSDPCLYQQGNMKHKHSYKTPI